MTEAGYLLDASAVLAMVFEEPGSERVEECLIDARISSANLSEVVAKLYDRKFDKERVELVLSNFTIETVEFDRDLAEQAGHLRPLTRHLGLSFGDRACLATAQAVGCTIVTADQAWAELDLGIEIELIR
jgi:ribonuclease VapC